MLLRSLLGRAKPAGTVSVLPLAARASTVRVRATAVAATASATATVAGGWLGGVRRLETGASAVYNAFRTPALDKTTGRFLALNRLRPAPGARKRQTMLGRGEGTHTGKSAGRGMRGTYHRRALHKRNFEGGQTPLHRRIPKRGHHIQPFFQEKFRDVSVGKLQYFIETGRIDPTVPIQLKHLFACGFKPKKDGIRLTGAGAHRVTFPMHVEVTRIDDLAKFAIEQAGGSVKLVYFTRLGLRAHLYPEKFEILPAATNIPPPKKRHIYAPYRGAGTGEPAMPPLLFKSRIAANSPLAKYWTPSPLATKYIRAMAQLEARQIKAGILPATAAASPKPAKATA